MAKSAKASRQQPPKVVAGALPITQPSPRRSVLWTPALLRSALLRADGGDLSLVADLCDNIIADDRFGELLTQLADDVVGCELSFEKSLRAVVGTADKSEELAFDWPIGYDDDELKSLLVWTLAVGVGFARHEAWRETENGRIVPVLKWWHPQHFCWMERGSFAPSSFSGDQRNHCWHVREPGTDTWRPIDAGDGTWIVVTRRGEYCPWRNGFYRALGAWWLLKQYAMQDSGVHSEKTSKIVISSDVETQVAERQDLAQYIYDAGKDAVITLPAGFKLDLVELTANLDTLYHSQIRLANDCAAVTILGQNLSTNVDGGSYAAAKEHSKKEGRRVRNAAQMLSKSLQSQSLKWWAEFNFGDSSLAPYPRWHTEPDDDYAIKAGVLLTVSQSLATLDTAGWDIDEASLEEDFGLILRKKSGSANGDVIQTDRNAQDKVDNQVTRSGVPTTDPKVQPPKSNGTPAAARKAPPQPQAFLASGDSAADAPGFIRGQLYVDDLSDKTAAHAADELAGWIDRLLEAVDGAKDYEDARYRIVKAFQNEADPMRLSMLVERGILLADLAGRYAVQEDTPEE
jgi:phage gp29-like protein